jgi:hypothetical protein
MRAVLDLGTHLLNPVPVELAMRGVVLRNIEKGVERWSVGTPIAG